MCNFFILFNLPGGKLVDRTLLTTKLRRGGNFIQVSFIISTHFLLRVSSTALAPNPTGIPVGSSWPPHWDCISNKNKIIPHVANMPGVASLQEASSIFIGNIRPACGKWA